MNCERIENEDLLRGLLNDTLSDDVKIQLKQHVGDCPSCQLNLQLCASLMLESEVVVAPEREIVAEPQPSIWQRISERLFPQGMGWLQPAMGFAVVMVVAMPVLSSIWSPADPDVSGGNPPMRALSDEPNLKTELPAALKALEAGQPQKAMDILDPDKVNWTISQMSLVFTAHRLQSHAAYQLGQADVAKAHLVEAAKYTELEPSREDCLQKDHAALESGIGFCALPATP